MNRQRRESVLAQIEHIHKLLRVTPDGVGIITWAQQRVAKRHQARIVVADTVNCARTQTPIPAAQTHLQRGSVAPNGTGCG